MAKDTTKTKYYLGNPNLPAAEAQIAYEPWMLRDISKSKQNLLHFAENFFYIINPEKGKKQVIKLFPYQKQILRTLRDNNKVILLASRQCGKALALSTPIPIPGGWTTMGELKDGDSVYGLDGKKCNVVKAHDVMLNRQCYKISFDNGEEIVADQDHLWYTEAKAERKKGGTVKTTVDILNSLKSKAGEPNHRVPSCIVGVAGIEQVLPINPYTLGIWLGDGASACGTITVGERDLPEVLEFLNNQQSQFDKIILHEYSPRVFTVRITSTVNPNTASLSSILRANNLVNNKHIPQAYMTASRAQRLELLQGLIDSDGYIDTGGNCNFYNTNIQLCEQVKELIESLGYKATYREYIPTLNGVECSMCGCVNFTPIEFVCKLKFKRDRIKIKPQIVQSKYRSQWHYIKNVEAVESVPVRCITVDSPDNLYLCGKQYIPTHNTTLLTIYALWVACFNDYQNIVIVANKEATAIEVFRRIKLAYEELPEWLKPGVISFATTACEFDNGSRISISTTTGSAARGMTITTLLLDELAFIEPASILDDFWRSVYPTISRSSTAKVLIASTPNGTGNLFYKLFDGAEKGENGFVYERVRWYDIPGRDEAWKQNEIKSMGSIESFLQEYETVFLESGESSIDSELFEQMQLLCIEPKIILDEGNYKIWNEPDSSRVYVAGVDVSEGVGADASVIQILDITDIKDIRQVAVYHNRNIPPLEFANKVHTILLNWGSPLALIERNNCGAQVVDRLAFDVGYEKVVSYGAKAALRSRPQMGMIAHTNTKYKGVMNMRYFVNEVRAVTIQDINTLKEMRDFVRHSNGTWKAKSGYHDDRVMSFMYALYILEKEITERYFDILELDDHGKPMSIEPMDFGVATFENATSIYNDFEVVGLNNYYLTPIVFGMGKSEQPSEMHMLEQEGWTQYGS